MSKARSDELRSKPLNEVLHKLDKEYKGTWLALERPARQVQMKKKSSDNIVTDILFRLRLRTVRPLL